MKEFNDLRRTCALITRHEAEKLYSECNSYFIYENNFTEASKDARRTRQPKEMLWVAVNCCSK